MARKTVSFSVSFPPKLRRELERESKETDMPKSAILRDAFQTVMLQRRLDRVQRVGKRKALELGIESEADLLRLLNEQG